MSRNTDNRRIAVIGSGIIGLSTAVRLQNALPSSYEITVFGKSLPPNTTGDNAAGVWFPSYYSNTPLDKIWRWSKKTWDYLDGCMKTESHADKGIFMSSLYYFNTKSTKNEKNLIEDIVYTYNELSTLEAQRMFPSAMGGYQITTLFAEGQALIDSFWRSFISNGGRCLKREIFSFDELINEGFDIIINCPGLGAAKLCTDEQTYPIRAQIRVIQAPWIKCAVITDNGNYIIPNRNKIIIGGTTQKDDWNLNICKDDLERIVSGCCRIMPSIKKAVVLKDWVGLRPGRTEVRLEREDRVTQSGKKYSVIHNYGHGGCGLTTFWGCAEEARDLALTAMKVTHSAKL